MDFVAVMLFTQQVFHLEFYFYFEQYCQENLAKSRGFGNKDKKGDDHIGGCL